MSVRIPIDEGLAAELEASRRRIAELEVVLAASQRPYVDELCREVFNASRDGIVLTDLEGGIVDANPAFLGMVGKTLAELKSRNWRDLMASGFYDPAAVLRRLSDGPAPELETEIVTKDGGFAHVVQKCFLIRDCDGRPRGLCCYLREIPERIRK